MKKYLIIIIPVTIIILCILIFLIAFKKANNLYSASTTDISGNNDVVQYAIDMDNYSFVPNLMKAQSGKDLKIKLISKNGNHSLKIDKLNFDSGIISNGNSKIITIHIPSNLTGNYEFYCGVNNHKEMGMIGTLQVGNF